MMNKAIENSNNWAKCEFQDLLNYIQPTNYIVRSTEYDDKYKIPVLTAGKSFIKGYTNEEDGIFEDYPVIIFDDFTTATKYVNFPFKVKSSAMKILRPSCNLVNLKFVYFAMQINEIRSDTHKRYWISVYAKKQFFIPPLNEQHRIIEKIDELFSKLDKGIENLKTAQLQLKVYRQALLKHACAGKDLNQKGIITQPYGDEFIFTLGDVIQTLGQGWSPRCLETPSQSNNDWGVIKTTAIQPLRFDDTKNKELPKGLRPRPHLEIIPGDVLITRAGPRTRVGIACFVKNTRPNLMVCDKAYRLQVQKEKILPQYLVMLLNTPEVLSELEKLKSGINDSGLNLTQEKFLTLKVIVPPIDHQQVILDDIEQKLTNVEFLEEQTEKSLLQAEALRQSILRKAFSGQLVSQDPNDESASILLEQIKISKGSL